MNIDSIGVITKDLDIEVYGKNYFAVILGTTSEHKDKYLGAYIFIPALDNPMQVYSLKEPKDPKDTRLIITERISHDAIPDPILLLANLKGWI